MRKGHRYRHRPHVSDDFVIGGNEMAKEHAGMAYLQLQLNTLRNEVDGLKKRELKRMERELV